MANRDTSRVSGNTRRGILYISRRKHFENYILFHHAHRICMIIVLIISISAILNSQNWSVVRIVSSHTVPNFWPCTPYFTYTYSIETRRRICCNDLCEASSDGIDR